jgi:hypothetical protein
MEAGQRVRQTVTLDLPNAGEVGGTKAPGGAEPDVVVRHRALGALPGIGLGAPCHGRPLTAAAAALLRGLALTHLRVELDLRGRAWRDPLGAAAADATGLGVGLEVAAVTERTGSGLEELAAALARSSVPVLRVVPFAEDGWVTTPGLVARARAAGLPGKVGGGSRTDFAQFNMLRARLPVGQIDFAAYAINPQVHAFDDMSTMETLGVQTETVSSARGLAGDVPIAVGPITLRPRFNPNATAPEPPRRGDEPPRHADPRQTRGFAAAWTVGSLHRLGAAGAAAVTYFETAGPCGVLDEAGAPYPVYDVFAAVGSFAGAEVLDVGLRDPLEVEALALRDGGRVRIVVGNLTPTARQVVVAPPTGTARVLDLGPYGVAAIDAG